MAATYLFLILYAVALLALVSFGLAVIFGLMRVINLAHGEFMMLGAYTCVLSYNAGLPYFLSLIAAMVVVTMFGMLTERLIVRQLYGRIADTLLVTWGLSLFMVGVATAIFGASAKSMQITFGTVDIAGSSYSGYSFVVIAIAALTLISSYVLASYTNAGLIVRGTMQAPETCRAIGVNTNFVYLCTFAYGSAMAGLAGAVLAPLTGASPMMGAAFVAKAFINVIVGGGLPLVGTTLASLLFGSIDGVVSYVSSSISGEIAVLAFAVVLLRLLPTGITGRFRRGM